jgi:hypothetical protein
VTLPHERLLEWFKLEDERLQLDRFESVFTVDAELDAWMSPWDRLLPMLEITAAMRDVREIVAEGDATRGVVILEGRDPVTNLWHRLAWTFSTRDGLISRVTSTASQGIVRNESPRCSRAR